MAQQERELAQTQQALHDMRAELMLAGQGQQQQQHEGGEAQVLQLTGAGDGAAGAAGAAARGGDAMEVDDAGGNGRVAQGPSPRQVHGAGATPADANGAAAGRSVQFPSITPGPGVLFPTPGTQLVRMRVRQYTRHPARCFPSQFTYYNRGAHVPRYLILKRKLTSFLNFLLLS